MKFLLRPGWIALVVAVIGFAAAAFTLLAPWQFGLEAQREAQQHAIDVASATAPVPLEELVPPGEAVASDDEWRQVTVTGTYLPDGEGLVRLRVVQNAHNKLAASISEELIRMGVKAVVAAGWAVNDEAAM